MNENKFDGLGGIYARFRPGYPDFFIDDLFADVGVSRGSVLADIGSGTGILTRQLLARGCLVYAVEPNDDMRRIAEKALSGFPDFISVHGTAENTTLPDVGIDFITVAQAFHWFDREKFKLECQRVLKRNGKVILVWNNRDDKSKLVLENERINRKFCPEFKGFSGGMCGETKNGALSDFFAGPYEVREYENPLHFCKADFIGRNLSSSYALREGDDAYHAYIGELEDLFDRYCENNVLTMMNYTRCYIGSV